MALDFNEKALGDAMINVGEDRMKQIGDFITPLIQAAAPRSKKPRRKWHMADKIKSRFNRYGDELKVQIHAPLPVVQLEYGHLAFGEWVRPRPFFWPTIDTNAPEMGVIFSRPPT